MRDLGQFDITPCDGPPGPPVWTLAGAAAVVFAAVDWAAAIAYWTWRIFAR
jgi:hypothetical protein